MLRIQNLHVSYGETLILRDLNLEIAPGEVVSLMGRNGVGKTTLLKSIIGLLRPRTGKIIFGDRDLTHTTPDVRARAGIGYVPQGREIFPQLTVQENLEIGLVANPERPRSVPEKIFEYFPALKDILQRKGGFLSGGQQQQLAIARVLAANPRLLLLDEPTEGIQPNVVTLIGHVLETLKKEGNLSVLLIEQYLEFSLKLADSWYVMEKGSIVMNGTKADLDKEAIKPYLAF